MKLEYVSINSLALDPNNARFHDEKNIGGIHGSLAKFGQQKPIVISDKNVVIAGNGTLQAAKRLGWEYIWAYRSELKGSDAMAFALADNRTAEIASWEDDILRATLSELQSLEFDVGAIGFDDKFLSKLFKDLDEITEPKEAKQEYLIVVECLDEFHQGKVFEELQEKGLQCKIM